MSYQVVLGLPAVLIRKNESATYTRMFSVQDGVVVGSGDDDGGHQHHGAAGGGGDDCQGGNSIPLHHHHGGGEGDERIIPIGKKWLNFSQIKRIYPKWEKY